MAVLGMTRDISRVCLLFTGELVVYSVPGTYIQEHHRTGATQLCVSDNIGITANIGLRDAGAGYHVAAEVQGSKVGASAEVRFASLDIYFEVIACF